MSACRAFVTKAMVDIEPRDDAGRTLCCRPVLAAEYADAVARLLLPAAPVASAVEAPSTTSGTIGQVEISPVFRESFMCAEHYEGEMDHPGDALGTDCVVTGGVDPRSPEGFLRTFRTDGSRNEDGYGWGVEVLAPFDGQVVRVIANDVVNRPDRFGRPPAAILDFEREDGVVVPYGHVADVRVQLGDHVHAGQVVAVVGNTGIARNPHIHAGALRDGTPLQIRWDLRAMGDVRRQADAASPAGD